MKTRIRQAENETDFLKSLKRNLEILERDDKKEN